MRQSGADWWRDRPEGLLQARDPGVKHSPHWLCQNQDCGGHRNLAYGSESHL